MTQSAAELEPMMARMREVAPTHHAYTDASTGHEFLITDRILALVSPAGNSVTLHQRTGGSADNIIQTYTPATKPQLQTLRGQSMQGTWRLRIVDLDAADVGKLNKWGLKITKAA